MFARCGEHPLARIVDLKDEMLIEPQGSVSEVQHWPDGRRGQAVQPIRQHGCPEVHNTYRIWLTSSGAQEKQSCLKNDRIFYERYLFHSNLSAVPSTKFIQARCKMCHGNSPTYLSFCVYAFVFYHRIFLFQRLAKSCMWFWTKSCHKNFSCMTGLVY